MKKLDDIDLRILTLLYKDADITNKAVSYTHLRAHET